MIFSTETPENRRKKLKERLKSKACLRFVGSFSPLVTALIEEKGFEGVYVSGAVLSADQGFPDVGLVTLSEVARRAKTLIQSSRLPSLVDGDTGFGSALNCARLTVEMETRGLSGLHIEDQSYPKRCGHLKGKTLVSTKEMVRRLQSAVKARRDKNFLIVARTDARGTDGMKEALERAVAYLEAGADVIFPEALHTVREFEEFRNKISAPLLANMTEFGKTEIVTHRVFEKMGYNIVIYPVSAFRLALKAVEEGLDMLFQDRQEELISRMQTRKRLYQLLRYKDYEVFDKKVFDFSDS